MGSVSMARLLAEFGHERLHRQRLQQLLGESNGAVRIASPYVTDRSLLLRETDREIRLITSLLPMDVTSGATNLDVLQAFINSGVECRFLRDRPRLHAKVYIFGTSTAIITSANLTESAMNSNIEVGAELSGASVRGLFQWYEDLWSTAVLLSSAELAALNRDAKSLRREFAKLQKQSSRQIHLPPQLDVAGPQWDELRQLLENASKFFVCNTDRRCDIALERAMHDRGYAAAWEDFRYPLHMERVKPGHVILAYAKGVGIIGMGRATGRRELVEPDEPGRIRDDLRTLEWRVPVKWLDWRDEKDAYSWKSPNLTFWNVSGEKWADFRKGVRQHFLSGD